MSLEPLVATIEPETGMVYLYIQEPGTEVARTVEVNSKMNLDYDSNGELVGIELFTGRTSSSSCQPEDLGPSTIDTLLK